MNFNKKPEAEEKAENDYVPTVSEEEKQKWITAASQSDSFSSLLSGEIIGTIANDVYFVIVDDEIPYEVPYGDFESFFESRSHSWGESQTFDAPVEMTGNGRVKRELTLPFNELRAPGTRPADFSGHGDFAAWEFANNAEETVVFGFRVPRDLDYEADNPIIELAWSSNTTEQDVVWQLEFSYLQTDTDTTTKQNTLTMTATSSSVADGLIVSPFNNVDHLTKDDFGFQARLKRLGDHEDDTLSDTAELHFIRYIYVANKLGETI